MTHKWNMNMKEPITFNSCEYIQIQIQFDYIK